MTTPITFTVYGKPKPAGSKRDYPFHKKDGGLGVSVSDANPKSKHWQGAISQAAYDAHGGELLDGPLSMSVVFYFPRPKGHFSQSKKSPGKLKPGVPEYFTGRPDALKLGRAVEDSLTGVIYRDDSQIVNETLCKRYGEPARTEVVVSRVFDHADTEATDTP